MQVPVGAEEQRASTWMLLCYRAAGKEQRLTLPLGGTQGASCVSRAARI